MSETKRVGVALSGCGVNDGAEIHEAVLTLLALDRAGVEVVPMAPNIQQMHVIDHQAGAPEEGASRNVLVESARIARGEIRDMAGVDASQLDALIFPGGFGAAKNLCTLAVDGPNMSINPDVDRLVKDMHGQGKPLGFICIAPALAAKSLGAHSPKLTIGDDPGTAEALEALGAVHISCPVDDIVVDAEQRIVTTPAYMLGPSIGPVSRGIDKLVERVVAMA